MRHERPPRPDDDIADRIELHTVPGEPRSSALPALVLWLRRVRDRRRQSVSTDNRAGE
jgi:hypothetical protein